MNGISMVSLVQFGFAVCVVGVFLITMTALVKTTQSSAAFILNDVDDNRRNMINDNDSGD